MQVTTIDNTLTVTMPRPSTGSDRIAFAADVKKIEATLTWHGFEELHTVFTDRAADPTFDPRSYYHRVNDLFTQVAASYAALANIGRDASERTLEHALACFDRIPAIGRLLRDGLISPYAFGRAVLETNNVTDEQTLATIDTETATRLRLIGGLSVPRVSDTVRLMVLKFDPDAVRNAEKAAKAGKNAVVVPLDGALSRLVITGSPEDIGLSKEALDAVVDGVCTHDPRSKDHQRSDAALARIGGTPFHCMCDRDDCDATLTREDIAERLAGIVLHVIVRKHTLDGADDTPAHLDGFGPISADHVRDIADREDATRRDVDIDAIADSPHQPGNQYRPTAACDAAVRGVFGRCSWPGCTRPAWKSDLDHCCEYDHDDPVHGGATCPCNLNPKCRFHHLLKTFGTGWIDSQYVDANGIIWTEVTTPEGHTVRQQAINNWLVPELGLLPCRHGPPRSPGLVDPDDEPRRELTRTQAKHRARAYHRAANRRARLAEEAAWGEPPF